MRVPPTVTWSSVPVPTSEGYAVSASTLHRQQRKGSGVTLCRDPPSSSGEYSTNAPGVGPFTESTATPETKGSGRKETRMFTEGSYPQYGIFPWGSVK